MADSNGVMSKKRIALKTQYFLQEPRIPLNPTFTPRFEPCNIVKQLLGSAAETGHEAL